MMQIRAIHLYGFSGSVRTLPFRLGGVNIVTGASRKGKSAILDIVDFCMGSRSYNVAEGRIRETVAWYALELQVDDGVVLAARPAPAAGRQSNTVMHIGYYDESALPLPVDSLQTNYDLNSARELISRIAGIRDNEVDIGDGLRDSFAANIRHAMFFTMQSQSEVASRSILFHSQGEERIPQAIRDTLPYFLGASDPDYIRKRSALRDSQRELRALAKQKSDQESLSASPRALSLLREAQDSGLLQLDDETDDLQVFDQLVRAAQADIGDPEGGDTGQFSEVLSQLRGERDQIRSGIAAIRAQNDGLRQLLAAHGNYGSEVAEQSARLESLGLLRIPADVGSDQVTSCPLCDSDLNEPVASVVEIQRSMEVISRDIESVSRSVPRLQELIARNESELAELNRSFRINSLEIEQQSSAQSDLESLASRALRRAAVRGRINLYLESVSRELESRVVDDRIQVLQQMIDELEDALRSDDADARLESAINRISVSLSRVAEELELEHSEYPVRLDRRRLTVVVDMRQGPRTLAQIGSAANWLGYHIAVLIALHGFFIEERRPVPRFLILDQPSQVYYPQGARPDDVSLADDDSASLARFFRAIFDFVENSEGEFQVIILEHADLPDQWYQDAVIERWRGENRGLIPEDWEAEA